MATPTSCAPTRALGPVGSHEVHGPPVPARGHATRRCDWARGGRGAGVHGAPGTGATGFDALVMGMPLVAMRGNWMGARLTSSMLKALGRPEWIAENRGEYVQFLQTLAADRSALAAIKQTLRSEVLASELCDQRGLARDLGAAFGGMVQSLKQ